MDLQSQWERALRETEIIRTRVVPLSSLQATRIPYRCLAESSLNTGDTVVRTGQVVVTKPFIAVPEASPFFEGFSMDEREPVDPDFLINFLLVRGVSFPSLRYRHERSKLEVREGSLSDAVQHYRRQLEEREDVVCGLLVGPEDLWQWSVLIFVATLIGRSASDDLRRLLGHFPS